MNRAHAQALLELIAECYLIITAPDPEPAELAPDLNGAGPVEGLAEKVAGG